MRRAVIMGIVSAVAALAMVQSASAGQAPGALSAPDVAVSSHDRVYAAEQFSNTVSVTDPATKSGATEEQDFTQALPRKLFPTRAKETQSH